MQELRLVAVSEDGTYLVLATAGRGTRFTLPVDDRLRAAVRGHFSRLGQFEIEVESPLRPKEIQARIRSGETAEEIAESAGIPVERVRWFEGPVLQEREYMAQQAQRVAVRRPGESTPGPPLGETVEERLGRGGVDLDEVEWDSWKCEDSTWRIRLSFFDNGRPHAAEWVFDPRRRHVSPLDEVAARLTAVDWDDDDLGDTVTPLLPRRPAMKIVSDTRDLGSPAAPAPPPPRGIGAGPEPRPPDRPERRIEPSRQEPLRAAEPVAEYGDLGRGGESRPRPGLAGEPPVASRPLRRPPVQDAPPEPEAPSAPAPLPKPAPAVEEEPRVEAVEEPEPEKAEAVPEIPEPEPEIRAADATKTATETAEAPEAEAERPDQDAGGDEEDAREAPSPEPEKPAASQKPPQKPTQPQRAQPAAKTQPQRPAHRESGRPPAKKKATGRPSMPPAPADKPVGPPAAAAAPSTESPASPQRPARNRRKSKGKRASVPSWDEIMFGARRPE